MTHRQEVDAFLAEHTLALVGASRSGRKFGNTLYKTLTAKGYEILLVHPEVKAIGGVPCVASLGALPKAVGGLVLVVPPEKAEGVVAEAAEAGIRRIWMQQGAASPAAIRLCEEKGITVVHGACLLMFASPTGIHGFHRWLWRVLRKLST